jgi:hypothetical protein
MHFRHRAVHLLQKLARFSELAINPLLDSMSRQTHQIRMRFPGRDGVPDLELPFPQAGFDQDEAEFNALAVHMQILRFAPKSN